jgi:hypothetical protein
MRIDPIGPRYTYWTIHMPWWRVKFKATYCNLPLAIQRALDIAARRLMRKRQLYLPDPQPLNEWKDQKPIQEWQPPSQPSTEPLGLHWPSDEPPPPPTKIDVRLVEEPRPPEDDNFLNYLA